MKRWNCVMENTSQKGQNKRAYPGWVFHAGKKIISGCKRITSKWDIPSRARAKSCDYIVNVSTDSRKRGEININHDARDPGIDEERNALRWRAWVLREEWGRSDSGLFGSRRFFGASFTRSASPSPYEHQKVVQMSHVKVRAAYLPIQ